MVGNKPNNPGRPFQVKPKIRRQLKQEKRKIIERLEPFIGGTEPRQEGRPEFSGPRPTYEMSERTRAVPYGGLAAVHQLVRQAGLPEMIDSQLGILKRARPYQDSDHVLNIAYNILCGGQVLDDIEVRLTKRLPRLMSTYCATGPIPCVG